jgi:PAS domain-containing protein
LAQYHLTLYSWILLAGATLSLLTAGLLWRQRATSSTIWLVLSELAVAEWSLGVAFESAAPTVPLRLLWSQLAYPGTTMCSVLFLLFAWHYADAQRRARPRAIIGLSAVPVLATLAAATNSWHRLLWTSITLAPGSSVAVYGHGPIFWVFIAYSYAALTIGAILLLRAILRFGAHYHAQTMILLLAVSVPYAGNILYVSGHNPLPGLDWTPVALALSGALLAWAILGLHMLSIVPIARNALIEEMVDAVLVLDSQDRLVDLNPVARQLIGTSGEVLGQHLGHLLAAGGRLLWAASQGQSNETIAVQRGSTTHLFDARLTDFHSPQGRHAGRMLVLRDVTQDRRLEQERENLLASLRSTLADARTLSGLLPICPRCKKIRDDQGYWHAVEVYVRAHTDANFTHGICPECAEKLYARYLGDEEDKDA